MATEIEGGNGEGMVPDFAQFYRGYSYLDTLASAAQDSITALEGGLRNAKENSQRTIGKRNEWVSQWVEDLGETDPIYLASYQLHARPVGISTGVRELEALHDRGVLFVDLGKMLVGNPQPVLGVNRTVEVVGEEGSMVDTETFHAVRGITQAARPLEIQHKETHDVGTGTRSSTPERLTLRLSEMTDIRSQRATFDNTSHLVTPMMNRVADGQVGVFARYSTTLRSEIGLNVSFDDDPENIRRATTCGYYELHIGETAVGLAARGLIEEFADGKPHDTQALGIIVGGIL